MYYIVGKKIHRHMRESAVNVNSKKYSRCLWSDTVLQLGSVLLLLIKKKPSRKLINSIAGNKQHSSVSAVGEYLAVTPLDPTREPPPRREPPPQRGATSSWWPRSCRPPGTRRHRRHGGVRWWEGWENDGVLGKVEPPGSVKGGTMACSGQPIINDHISFSPVWLYVWFWECLKIFFLFHTQPLH